jgi:ribosome modulation factor
MTPPKHDPSVEAPLETYVGVALEGCADYFLGRPRQMNPYSPNWEPAYSSWLEGWDEAKFFDETRGDQERRRWQLEQHNGAA